MTATSVVVKLLPLSGPAPFSGRSRPDHFFPANRAKLISVRHRHCMPIIPGHPVPGEARRPLSAADSTAAMRRCTSTASSKDGAVRVPLRRSAAILA